MKILNKIVGFLAVCSVVPAAQALTARPGFVNPAMTNASRRLPTMVSYISSTTSTSNSTSLMEKVECVDNYMDCISESDACGSNFEECTTNVLFHAQMPKCSSVLLQCKPVGIEELFGTSSTTALSNPKTINEYDEVTEYQYPTAGSVLEQMITAAAISNAYNTGDCIRRYTTCLQRDNVCGADFELCTTTKDFRKQMIYCDSTLARCQAEGKIELFGSASNFNNPASGSRIDTMIQDGAALAAVNAVSTCYKVVDQCILNACSANPYKCLAESSKTTAKLADAIKTGVLTDAQTDSLMTATESVSKSEVRAYVRNACMDTIGANKYCYATYLGNGSMPSADQLSNPDNQEIIFEDAYDERMNSSMTAKINDALLEFDSEAKMACSDTISSCVMRVCGGGSGAGCYALVFSTSGNNTINGGATYEEIKTGCEAIVNTDINCQYAAQNPDDAGGYTYTYNQTDTFTTLFPPYKRGITLGLGSVLQSSDDPIGVVAELNASLATSYSDAAIAQLRTRCQNVAKSCVKAMCGDEYVNCYRNRNDIYSSLTNTGTASYDNSMNRVGGVLDYTIILGLCLDTVKTADVCQEHLDIEIAKLNSTKPGNQTSTWGEGTSSVRQGWLDAGSSVSLSTVEDGTQVRQTDSNGNALCRSDEGNVGICDTVDKNTGEVYDDPLYISTDAYQQNLVAETLFSELVYDLEKEAQAIYNSRLTQEQNMCLAANQGGLMTKNDTGSTFMWAKLRNNRVPDDYNVSGLTRNSFDPSNELYGSFCAVRVTIQSDDSFVQEAMRDADWTNVYFAVGDTFTCGSWIPADELEDITEAVAEKATEQMVANQQRTEFWTTLLGVVGGGLGGAYLGAGIQDGTVFKKLNVSDNESAPFDADRTNMLIDNVIDMINGATSYDTELYGWDTYISNIKSYVKKSNVSEATLNAAITAADAWKKQYDIIVKADEKITEAKSTMSKYEEKDFYYQNAEGAKEKAEKDKDAAVNKIDDLKNQAIMALERLQDECDAVDGVEKESKVWGGLGATLGAVATAAVGGWLVNRATRDIQASNLSAAEQAAIEEWMDKIGRHIKCYIGPDEAGKYGDTISVTMD